MDKLEKQDMIEVLESYRNKENDEQIDRYIEKLKAMSDWEIEAFCKKNHLNKKEDLISKINNLLKQEEQKFIPLNELISYGITKDTIHIHVVPKDARQYLTKDGFKKAELFFIDAMEQIRDKLLNEKALEHIRAIYAISGILKKPITRWFENLAFDVNSKKMEEARTDRELEQFCEMFKNHSHLGMAKIEKERLLSKEWETLKDNRKLTLKNEWMQVEKNTTVSKLQEELKKQVKDYLINESHDVKEKNEKERSESKEQNRE